MRPIVNMFPWSQNSQNTQNSQIIKHPQYIHYVHDYLLEGYGRKKTLFVLQEFIIKLKIYSSDQRKYRN